MQNSQKNFMRIIGNDQKNNGQNFWEILERIIGKILSAGLFSTNSRGDLFEKVLFLECIVLYGIVKLGTLEQIIHTNVIRGTLYCLQMTANNEFQSVNYSMLSVKQLVS